MSSANEHLGVADEAYYQKYYSSRPPKDYCWLLSNIVSHGQPGNILDLGCGLGLFVEMASKWGMDVQGCDGSKDAIGMTLQRNPTLKVRHCLLGSRLPFNDCSFNNVLLNQVIEHLPAPVLTNALSECNRVLRRGGMLFILSPNKANKAEVQKDPTHINPLYPSELRSLLNTAGFEVVAEPISSRFDSRIPFASRLLRILMKTSLKDWLSSSTNAYARKR